MLISHRGWRLWVVTLSCMVGALVTLYCRLTASRLEVREAMARVVTYGHYELRADGKVVLSFGHDSLWSAACWADRWELIPGTDGALAVTLNDSLERHLYDSLPARKFLAMTIDSVRGSLRKAEWNIKEFNYWARSHQVQDEGYEMAIRYHLRQVSGRDSLRLLLQALTSVPDKARLSIVYATTHVVRFTDSTGKSHSLPCQVVRRENPEVTWMRAEADSSLAGIHGLPPSLAIRYARLASVLPRRHIHFRWRPDSLGVYLGQVDSLFRPSGHGAYIGRDGNYYEGHWVAGKRDGFGFSVIYPTGWRTGEWKEGRFMGERLLYRSDRVYGIDISKYQHGKGRKRYAIRWAKLRITDLGRSSRKRYAGKVDYPISFIYIKATEGSTVFNPYYKTDYAAARRQGFKVGSYHFFSIFTPAERQARHFLRHARLRQGDLPPVLDVEPSEAQIRKIGGDLVLFQRMRVWLRMVERRCGRKPILYVSQQFMNRHMTNAPDLLRDYQVWIARYGEYKPDAKLVFWQLCQDGTVRGIHGHVDINVFNGYQQAYEKFLKDYTLP